MIKKLLILGCVLIPFYEVFLYFFIPGRTVPVFPDMRFTKEFVSMVFCVLIGSAVLCSSGFKKPKNLWIPAFLLFLVWNIYKAPVAIIQIQGVNFNGMWNYRPVLKIFSYFYLFLAVSSAYFKEKDIFYIFKTIMYCGLAMSILMILQFFKFDQIFNTFPPEIIGNYVTHPEMGGSIGQATLSSPFLVMCIPFTIYFREWLYAVIMGVSVVIAGSSFALAGLGVVILLLFLKNIKNRLAVVFGFSSIGVIILVFASFHPDLLNSNGRFGMWEMVWNELFSEKIAFTGAGLGAFRYFFALRHQNTWFHAHNEYLQLLWCCGIIGFGIVFMIIKDFIKHSLENINPEIAIILISMAGIAVVSFGTFPLQLAVYQFYLVAMVGIVYSLINGGHYEQRN